MAGHKLVIGLDFGTTYTGVAFCDSSKGKDVSDIRVITSWPGLNAIGDAEKVPSRISYLQEPNTGVVWGNQIKASHKLPVHALMKLQLDEDRDAQHSRELRALLRFLTSGMRDLELDDILDDPPPQYPGKSPEDLVADYLGEVRKHVTSEMIKTYGEQLYSSLKKELVVTVPAVWSERAKDLTLKAVQKSGWETDTVGMVTEPEAAAIYTLKYMTSGVNKEEVQIGDHFVLCDAGGGTVDLISYTITKIDPSFNVEEAAIGTGAKCGATYVDKEFIDWLKNWIGEQAFNKIPDEKLRHGSQLMNSFETHKQQFTGDEDEIMIPLPRECGIDDDEDLCIEDRTLMLTTDQMKAFFEPCVKKTLELIEGQVQAVERDRSKPKMVLVVGGFGRNQYLYNRIVKYCEQNNLLCRTPASPWSAVSRGAVCRGLEGLSGAMGSIQIRLCRKYYGTPMSELFDPDCHVEEDAYVDKFTGKKHARGQMVWLFNKGERLREDEPNKAYIECFSKFKASDDRTFGAMLVGCDDEDAPVRYADDKAYNICRVVADLSSVPDSKFMKAQTGPDQEPYYIAVFKLQATFTNSQMDWTFVFDGKTYGSVTANYDSI